MSLGTLTSVLIRTVMALSSSQSEPDLCLMAAFSIALVRQGSPKKMNKARAALLRASRENLISATASDETPLDGLVRTGAFIVLPFLLSSPDTPPGITGEDRGPQLQVGGAESESTASSSAYDMKEIGPLRTSSTPSRQMNSTWVEHRYTNSRTLFSALDRALHFILQGSDGPQNHE